MEGYSKLSIAYAVRPKKEPHIVRPKEIKNLAWLTFEQWGKYAKNQQLRSPKAQMQALRDYRDMKNSSYCPQYRNRNLLDIIKTLF